MGIAAPLELPFSLSLFLSLPFSLSLFLSRSLPPSFSPPPVLSSSLVSFLSFEKDSCMHGKNQSTDGIERNTGKRKDGMRFTSFLQEGKHRRTGHFADIHAAY